MQPFLGDRSGPFAESGSVLICGSAENAEGEDRTLRDLNAIALC